MKYTIIAPLCDAELLDLIQTSLKLTGSIDFICNEKRVSYLIDDKVLAHFMQTIARLTVCYYKKKYYTSLFSTMCQRNKLGCLLLSALVWYDLEQESSQAYKCLPDSHYLNLLGFYQFRLPFLENRWNELSQMLRQLIFLVGQDDAAIAITRYLLSIRDCNCDTAIVRIDRRNYRLSLTDQGTQWSFVNSDQLIDQIIKINPYRLIVEGNDRDGVTYILKQLYDKL